jgi:hypothetical protein
VEVRSILCGAGSGWACNEAGQFERGCRLGFVPACRNAIALARTPNQQPEIERAPPMLADYPILLRGSKGPLSDRTPATLQARACEQGWRTCGGIAIRD